MSKTNTSKSSMLKYFKAPKNASSTIILLDEKKINTILKALAKATISESETLLKANKKDLVRMAANDPKYDRLKLTEERIKDITHDLVNVSKLPFPIGKVLEERTMENGLNISKVSVPLGVIGIIYEARPNVTFDAFSLCLKSGNVCILKGGSDAQFSNEAIVALIRSVLNQHGVDENMIALLPPDRKATAALLEAIGYVDVVIPRGSQQLINFVRQNAKIPVIETGAGVVHVFMDESGDIEKGRDIIFNSKTRRVSVCNALDCLLIHANRLKALASLVKPMAEKDVVIYADTDSYKILKNNYPGKLLQKAKQEHFGTEFLDYKMAIKTVKNAEEAISHIAQFGSKHSESIVSENQKNINKFTKEVDAAVMYINASTAFTDGAQFGLGAEIGISTQKLHARGPMALNEMTTYKWIVKGQGQIRN